MNILAKKKSLEIKQKQRFKSKKEKGRKKKRKMDIYLSVQNLFQSKKYRISLSKLKRTPKYKVIRFIRNHFSKKDMEGFLPQYYVVKILNSPTKKKSSAKHGHQKSMPATRSKDVFASEGKDEKAPLYKYDHFGYFLGPHFTVPSTSEQITSPEFNRYDPPTSLQDENTETDVFDELIIGNQITSAPNSSDAIPQYEELPNILDDVIDINHPVGLTEEITSAESMQWEKEIFSFEGKHSIDTGIWEMIYEKLPEEYNIPDAEFVSELQQKKQELNEPLIKNKTTSENTEKI